MVLPYFITMRAIKEIKEFAINVTYEPAELNKIVGWYVANHMPAIYVNYDLEDDGIANMIEEKAVMKLMEEGSNRIMTDYIGELILEFSMTNDEGNYE